MKDFFLKYWEHFACILIILLFNIIYFYPQFEGKKISQSDIVSSNQSTKALSEYRAETGKTYLWNPAQFSGMPVLSGAPSRNNLVYRSYVFLRFGFGEPAGLFIAGMLMTYFMLILLGINPWLSLIFSIGAIMATNNLILWEAGHNSKIRTLIFTPILIAGTLITFERKNYLVGFLLLAFSFSMSFQTRHPQMTYYILIVMGVYGLVKIFQSAQSKEWSPFTKGVLIALASIIIGLGTSATKTWSLYSYSKSTMRGDAILESSSGNDGRSSSEVDGLAWEYAMQWSNDLKDVMAMYIPRFVGGGNGEKLSRNSQTYQTFNIQNGPMYWGQLPITVGPIYLGAVILFLFVFGLSYLKGGVKWWLGLGFLLMVLLSLGKNFEIFNRLIFDYLPFYNKFRAPQSVLSGASFFVALLGAISLQKLVDQRRILLKSKKKKINEPIRQEFKKALLIALGVCCGVALLTALVGPVLFSFEAPSDVRLAQQGADLTPILADRKSMMRSDAFRSLVLVSLMGISLWLFMKKKIGETLLYTVFGLLVLFDVVGVGTRYLGHDKFKMARVVDAAEPRPVDQQILSAESKRENYRVHDLTINTFNSSEASYWHNTIGGYHPAKLQRYQDLIERHIATSNLGVLSMLNTKYIITTDQNGQPGIQQNPSAMGNAWFVDIILKVDTPNDEIDRLGNVDPRTTAVVLDQEFDSYVGDFDPDMDRNGSIQLIEYEPDRLVYRSNASSEQFAVFSEIWYGPDKGWKTYIDGEEVDHIRANYALRAMRVPAGNHEIIFEFRPPSYYTGEKIALGSSVLLLLLFLGVAFGGLTGMDLNRIKILKRQ